MNKPLTFTAKESNSTIYLAAAGSPVINGLQYRLNENDDWQQYKIGIRIILINVGDYVQFQNVNNELSTSYDDYVYFKMSGKIAASGNMQSMLNYSNSCSSYCYCFLFWNCISLIEAPELPATELADGCYSHIFYGCTNLIETPELPATALAKYCYYGMFDSCTSLTKALALPAIILAKGCYSEMFYSCSNLTEAPELPATNLAKNCYRFMFRGCKSLKNKPKISSLIEQIVYNY